MEWWMSAWLSLCPSWVPWGFNSEGIQTLYRPEPDLERISSSGTDFVRLMQELYAEPIKPN